MIHLDVPKGQDAKIFLDNGAWKRVLVGGSPSSPKWLRLPHGPDDPKEAADGKTHRILEHAYQHPETTVPLRRYPRLSRSKPATDAERTEDRIAELDKMVFMSLTRRNEACIEMGRAFNELKALLGHGKWLLHFRETFKPHGLNLRTAERYMCRARKADAAGIDNVSNFTPATDRHAQEIKNAVEQSQADVAAAPGGNKVDGAHQRIYRLPIHITESLRNAIEALRRSEEWPRAEQKIIRLLEHLAGEKAGRRRS